jgi:hypothetical protein
MLIVDMRAVKLPGEAKQNNQPVERGQPIDAGAICNAQYSLLPPYVAGQN